MTFVVGDVAGESVYIRSRLILVIAAVIVSAVRGAGFPRIQVSEVPGDQSPAKRDRRIQCHTGQPITVSSSSRRFESDDSSDKPHRFSREAGISIGK